MPISQHPALPMVATIVGTVALGFGFNYIFNSRDAFIHSFGFPYPKNAEDQKVINSFCVLFGAKDLFMGGSIYTAAWLGSRKVLGAILLLTCMCATIDGVVIKGHVGYGEWNHWGYGSVCGVIGLLSLGLLG